jgi:integrase
VFVRTGFRRRWANATKAARLDDVRFHDLRHTFASWARIAGADLATIKEAMDHSHISVTMRYAHINPQTHRTAFDAAADMLNAAQSTAQPNIKGLK